MRVASVAEAQHDILANVRVQPSLRVPIADTVGHVLAEDVIAAIPLPPWTNAAMDGYAVRASDVRGASVGSPVALRVIAQIAAGQSGGCTIGAGEAARIFTGAPVPEGADSVIRQEDTDRGTETVLVRSDRDAGANLRLAGGDLQRDALALAAGTPLGPHQLALLAAVGMAHPMVHRFPRVGILVTGDEIVSLEHPDEILSMRRLADVNGTALTALAGQAGASVVWLGIVRDDPGELFDRVREATDVDLLITAGGVSVGDHDHVRAVMARCAVKLAFERVRVRPGGPTAFGVFPDGRAWLGLPGNPVSAMVTFELFGRPAIRAMAGHRAPLPRPVRVILGDDVRRDTTLDQYLRCTLRWPAGGALPEARLTGPQGSGMLTSMVKAECLVVVEAGDGAIAAGTAAMAVLL